ncbi:lamin tail domain-containing protein [Paenibacillus hamazuiensis]|uniref:lamin tail domain-containing protein n=1 Tax=Paenibacillus hamazuiensis TaxID=2936508 RepID=UPI00200CC4DC|nr:lamin tail domain-containing protein [Paenibacillus hamazuiensis]
MKLFRKFAPAFMAASLLASLSPVAPAAQAASNTVVIAEVFNGSDGAEEWVTLANLGTTDIDLTNWALQDYSGSGAAQAKWTFPSGSKIQAKKLLVIEKTAGNSGAAAKGVATITGGSFNFAGASDRLDLINASNALVDGLAWGSSNSVEGFSIASSSTSGSSFERKTATDTDKAADWQAVSGTAVQAYAWAPLPGQTTSAPVITAVSPVENAVNVATTANLTVTFDKTVAPGTGSVTLLNKTDSLSVATFSHADAAVDVVGSTLTIDLPNLTAGKEYEITIPEGFVLSGSSKNGLKTWTFSTAPILSSNISAVRSTAVGQIVSVRGEVTGVFGSNNVWIQDTTAGIRVYKANGISGLTVGQEVVVFGTVANYNNDLELDVYDIQVKSDNLITLPAPSVVAVNQVGEANEGKLVKVQNVWIKSDYTTGAGGVVVTDGTNDLVVYAQAGTDVKTYLQGLPKSSANKFDIVGISSVFNTTIELLPRTTSDITAK